MIMLRFTRGTGAAGAIVRWGTWSSFAHVGFALDGTDKGLVLDSTPEFGVCIRHAEDDDTTQYYQILGSEAHIRGAVKYAKLQMGRPYDWTAIYGMLVRRDWWNESKFFCSELVEAAFSHVHFPLVRDSRKFDRITPRDLLLSPRIKQIIPPED